MKFDELENGTRDYFKEEMLNILRKDDNILKAIKNMAKTHYYLPKDRVKMIVSPPTGDYMIHHEDGTITHHSVGGKI